MASYNGINSLYINKLTSYQEVINRNIFRTTSLYRRYGKSMITPDGISSAYWQTPIKQYRP